MANCEARLVTGFSTDCSVVTANIEERSGNLAQVLRDTAVAVSRRVMWVMELLAVAGLVFCLGLMSAAHGGPEALALGLALIYFSVSAGLGAYLLRLDLTDHHGPRVKA